MTEILIITADFYPDITQEMLSGATQTLEAAGAQYEVMSVPGAFEIPGAIRFALHNKRYDGFVALGCVIRGETTHYDYVCAESARGLMNLALEHNAALGYGILTVENEEQAWERAKITQGNKGKDAALAALRMVEIKRTFNVI